MTYSKKPYVIGGLISLVVLIALIGGCSYATSFDAPRPGYSAVCQTGGPIEGDSGTCGFLAAGSGKRMIGYQNTLVEFPAQNRFWRTATNDEGQVTKGADAKAIQLPASNGGIVTVDTILRFKLKQDERTMLDFYKKHGTRSYGGPLAKDDPDEWWDSFLASQVAPVEETALRQELAPYSCAELNPSCDLTKLNSDLEKLAEKQQGGAPTSAQGREASQKLNEISAKVTERMKSDLVEQLGGDFLTAVDFKIVKVSPPADLVGEINEANAALARLVRANADARTKVANAKGDADARTQEARGRRALSAAYAKNSALAKIEIAKALCGPEGCQSLQVLGGDSNLLTQLK